MDVELPADRDRTQVVAFVLVLARVGGLFVLAPVFSARALPRAGPRRRRARARARADARSRSAGRRCRPTRSTAAAPARQGGARRHRASPSRSAAIVAAVQSGPGLVDTLIGFSYAAIVDPFSSIQGGVLGQLYASSSPSSSSSRAAIQIMIAGLAGTYEVVPLTATPVVRALAAARGRRVRAGLRARARGRRARAHRARRRRRRARARRARGPQLNVFAVGLPAKILVGVAVVAASLPFVARPRQRRARERRRRRPHAIAQATGRRPMAGDKTEKATPKRREEARKKGQVARSAEISTAVVLLAGLARSPSSGRAARPGLRGGAARRARAGLETRRTPRTAGLAAIARWAMHSFVRRCGARRPRGARRHARPRRRPDAAAAHARRR